MKKVEKETWEDRLAASEWMPHRLLRMVAGHGGRYAKLPSTPDEPAPSGADRQRQVVKLALRLPAPAAELLAHNAAALGLSYGAYVARLVHGTPLPLPAADRAALLLHSDRLAQWAVDLHSLTRLLRAGCMDTALQHLASSNAMAADVRCYLDLASSLLARSGTDPGGFACTPRKSWSRSPAEVSSLPGPSWRPTSPGRCLRHP